MKPKQARNVLSDASYPLTTQESKEYLMPTLMPYYQARALAKVFGLSLFQAKEQLIRDVERKLFFDDSAVKLPKKDLQKYYESEFFIHQRVSAEVEANNQVGVASLPGYEESKGLAAIFGESWAFQEKKLGCEELYQALFHFGQPNMIFLNHLRNASTNPKILTPILFCPYSISTIPLLSDTVLLSFAKYLGLNTLYEEGSRKEIVRQKLRDLFYLIEDHEDLHLVLPCQSYLKNCNEIASEYCSNYMCKVCCQSSGYKLPCTIHDDYTTFYKYK